MAYAKYDSPVDRVARHLFPKLGDFLPESNATSANELGYNRSMIPADATPVNPLRTQPGL